MGRIEQTIKANGLQIDKASLKKIEKTINMYSKTSKIRFRKEIKELSEVKEFIKEKLK